LAGHIFVQVDAVAEYAMQTPDGTGRVEVVKYGRTRWYRAVQGDNQLDWLSIAGVRRILGEAGVDIADLVEVTDWPPGPVDNPNRGAA
jgi:bifunctional non-homologous end joining protein LigD